MALTKVRGGAIDNPLTLGGGSASDNSIIFDGNAQDFHIGLDDSADSLTIGLGSTLGTTSHMVFDATGAITKPLQPAFLAKPASTQSNVGVNLNTDVAFGTEIFDQNGDFASSVFTAPVAGRYQLSANIFMQNINDAYSYLELIIETSNRSYVNQISPVAMFDADGVMTVTYSILADMDASDTAKVTVNIPNEGSNQLDIHTYSRFSGYLAC